jgi:hypothetical protein
MDAWFLTISLGLLFTGMIYTMVTIGHAASGSDIKNEMSKSITTVTVVNGILIAINAGLAFVYLNGASEGAVRIYTVIMTHLSLFIAMLSVSISSFQLLNAS